MTNKMNMKTLLISIIMVVLISATACGKSSTGDSATGEKSAEPTDLTVWWYAFWNGKDGTPEGWIREKADEFMALHPNVKKINIEMLPGETGVQKIDTSIAAGSPPDVTYIDLAFLPKYLKQKAVIPVSDYMTQEEIDDFIKSTSDYATYDGKMYALPILIAPRVLYANKTMLEEMGLADKLPLDGDRAWTIEQFNEIARKFPYKKDGKTYYAEQINTTALNWTHLFWFWNFGADLYNKEETKFILNSPEGVKALDYMLEMVDAGSFRLVTGGAKPSDFWAGDLAFSLGLALTEDKVKETLKQKTPEGKPIPEVVAVQFPKGPGVDIAKSYSGIGGLTVFKQKKADENHTKMAVEFAKFLTNGENNKVVKELGVFPTKISSGDVFGGDVNAKIARIMMEEGKDLGRGEQTYKIFEKLINAELDSAFSKKKTSQQTLDDLAKKANEMLKQ